jgi:uncharacterized protein (DUF2164 family)
MTEFRTTATHDGRAVPMPEVNAAECDEKALRGLLVAYYRNTTTGIEDAADFRARILADARAALLDAVDEDVAGLRQTHPTIAGIAYNAGITDARAAIRARKETT